MYFVCFWYIWIEIVVGCGAARKLQPCRSYITLKNVFSIRFSCLFILMKLPPYVLTQHELTTIIVGFAASSYASVLKFLAFSFHSVNVTVLPLHLEIEWYLFIVMSYIYLGCDNKTYSGSRSIISRHAVFSWVAFPTSRTSPTSMTHPI